MQEELARILADRGAQLIPVSMPLVMYALPFYFTLVPSEASSNLSRYDGLKYGYQLDFTNLQKEGGDSKKKQELFDYIERIKSEAFGINVKRRVILGNFLLSSRFEDFNEKVIEAQKIRRLIIDEYCKVFEGNKLDLILSPVALGEAPKIEDVLNQTEKKNPVYEYKMDYYTAFPNCTGTPAITMPVQERGSKAEFPTSFKL